MADEHIPNVDNRNEPTLGNSRNTRSQPGTGSNNGVGGQLNHERRDERRHVRIDAPFQVKLEDGHSLPGHDLSLGGFSIHSDKPFEEGRVASMSLLLMAGSAELIVPVTARALRNQSERKGNSHEIAFEIVKIDCIVGNFAQSDHGVLVVIALDRQIYTLGQFARALRGYHYQFEPVWNLDNAVFDRYTGHRLLLR